MAHNPAARFDLPSILIISDILLSHPTSHPVSESEVDVVISSQVLTHGQKKKKRHWDFKINADYGAMHCLGVKGNGEENTSLIQRQSPCTGALTRTTAARWERGRLRGHREGERDSRLLFKSKCKCKDCWRAGEVKSSRLGPSGSQTAQFCVAELHGPEKHPVSLTNVFHPTWNGGLASDGENLTAYADDMD